MFGWLKNMWGCDRAYGNRVAAREREALGTVPMHSDPKLRDWQIQFEVSGEAGEVKTATVTQECFFRGEKMVVQEECLGGRAGTGTKIIGVFIGARREVLPLYGILSRFYAVTALGNGLGWSTCQPHLPISVQVHFLRSGTWRADVFGKCYFAQETTK